jgi:hypothetical protein
VLAALAIADEIRIGAVRARHRGVVLLDASFHFGKQRFLQLFGVGERGLGVGVLGLEIAADLRVEHGRIAHHLAPIVRAQPGVVVRQRDAVPGRNLGVAFRARGRRQARCAIEHHDSGKK